MTEQEELIQEIRERLGEMPKGVLPFDLVAFATTVGERYSMTQNEIIRLVMKKPRPWATTTTSGRARAEGEMTIPRPQEWTKAEVHQLRMLAKRKVSADSIAKLLGRYVGSVRT